MDPKGLEMRLERVKALIQVQKQIASPPRPLENGPTWLPSTKFHHSLKTTSEELLF